MPAWGNNNNMPNGQQYDQNMESPAETTTWKLPTSMLIAQH